MHEVDELRLFKLKKHLQKAIGHLSYTEKQNELVISQIEDIEIELEFALNLTKKILKENE